MSDKCASYLVLIKLAAIGALGLTLSGCWYNYAQNGDRVAYGAGDSVKANLEIQTVNPSSDEQYDVSDLGEDGNVANPESDPGL